jgi:heat shock protein HslJ
MKIRPDKTTCIVLFILALLVAGCRATADLGGTSWQLTAYGPTDAPLDAEAPASIQFEDNGRLGGFTGCTAFFGHYRVDDGRISLRDNELAFTLQECDADSPEGMQGTFFRAWLTDIGDYSQTDDGLQLVFDEGRQIAVFVPKVD